MFELTMQEEPKRIPDGKKKKKRDNEDAHSNSSMSIQDSTHSYQETKSLPEHSNMSSSTPKVKKRKLRSSKCKVIFLQSYSSYFIIVTIGSFRTHRFKSMTNYK